MQLTEEMIEQIKVDFTKAKTYEDLMGKDGAIKKLIKSSLETMLESELTEHLGYEKYSPAGKNSGNNRNEGFPDAINAVFPKTEIQLCVIHLIRNTLRYIVWKNMKLFMKDLTRICH